MIRFFTRLLNYTLIACFLASLWGGWYASRQGFGRKWRKKLSEEFARRGVEMTAQRLTLDPLRGLVAHDARVFRDGKHKETVASINELRLDINYTRLLRNEPFLDALILSEADLNLDFNPKTKGVGETSIHHLSAEIYFHPGHFEIRRLQGEGLGMRFSIAGTLEHAPGWQIPKNPSISWQRFSLLPQNGLQNISELKFGPKLGRLDLRLRGNLSQNQWLQSAEGQLEIPFLEWRGINFRQVIAEADWTNKVLTLRKLKWRDEHGHAAASGTWHPGVHGDFQVDSKIDGTPYFRQIGPLSNLTVEGRMHLNGNILWNQSPATDWQIVGQLDATKILFREASWDHVQTRFSMAHNRWLLPDLKLTKKGGAISGEVFSSQGQLQARLVSTVDPRFVWSGFDPPSWLSEIDFPVNPWIRITIMGPLLTPMNWETEGEIILGRTNFRGVAITSGQANFLGHGKRFFLSPLQITRPEGQLTAEAVWKPGSLTLWNVNNSIDLVALGFWVNESMAEALETVRLEKGATIKGDGVMTWRENGSLEAQIQLRKAEMDAQKMPVFHGLAPSLAGDRAMADIPQNGEAVLTLKDGLLTADNLVVSGSKWKLRGTAEWNLQEKKFAGQLTVSSGSDNDGMEEDSWFAQGPWEKITWHRRP